MSIMYDGMEWQLIVIFDNIVVPLMTSAITAIVFTGGTNYFLQKKNRKATNMYAYTQDLINKSDEIYNSHIQLVATFVPFYNYTEDYGLKEIFEQRDKLRKYAALCDKMTLFFGKKSIKMMREFHKYLSEELDNVERLRRQTLEKEATTYVIKIDINNSKLDKARKKLFEELKRKQ